MTVPFAGPEWESLRQQATRRCYQPKGLIVYNMRGERVWISKQREASVNEFWAGLFGALIAMAYGWLALGRGKSRKN